MALTFMCCSTMTIWVYYSINTHENAKAEKEFEKEVIGSSWLIKREVQMDIALLRLLKIFFGASELVEKEEFEYFVKNIVRDFPSIYSADFIIKFDKGQKQSTQNVTINNVTFSLKELGENNSLSIANDKNLYFPIIYSVSASGTSNPDFIGFDFFSSELYKTAMGKAARTGKSVATGPLVLLREKNYDQKGILIFEPIYKNQNINEYSIDNVYGFLSIIFKIDNIVSIALENIKLNPKLNIIVEDVTDDANTSIIYQKSPEQYISDNKFLQSYVLDVASKKLKFTFLSDKSAYLSDSYTLWLVLAAGGIFSALMPAILFLLIRSKKRTESEIEDRVEDLKESRREIQDRETRLANIIDNAVDGLITIDDKGIIQDYNAACEKMFGYSAYEVVGTNVKILMPEPYHSEHDGYIDNYKKTNKPKIIGIGREVRGKRKNGSTFPMDLSVSEFRIGDKRYFSGILKDITERKESEKQKDQLLEKLTESNKELEKFAYVASHDLQEPLRMVTNFTGLLEKRYKSALDERGIEYIKLSSSAAARMQELIEDLLEYSKLGSEAETYSEISSSFALDYVKENLSEAIKESKAVITCDNLPFIVTNPIRFARLLQNLIGNSLKYSKKNLIPKIHIGASEGADYWQFYVKDNGIGMKQEYCEKIFLPFKRLHGKDEYSGTGIGLSICKKIVEKFGGKIWAESELDIGSTFYFTVPKILNQKKDAA